MPLRAAKQYTFLASLILKAEGREQSAKPIFFKEPKKSLLIQDLKTLLERLPPITRLSTSDADQAECNEEGSPLDTKDDSIPQANSISRKRKRDEESPVPLTTTKKRLLDKATKEEKEVDPMHEFFEIVNRFSYESLIPNDLSLLTKFLCKFPIYLFNVRDDLLEKLQKSLFCRINEDLFSKITRDHYIYLKQLQIDALTSEELRNTVKREIQLFNITAEKAQIIGNNQPKFEKDICSNIIALRDYIDDADLEIFFEKLLFYYAKRNYKNNADNILNPLLKLLPRLKPSQIVKIYQLTPDAGLAFKEFIISVSLLPAAFTKKINFGPLICERIFQCHMELGKINGSFSDAKFGELALRFHKPVSIDTATRLVDCLLELRSGVSRQSDSDSDDSDSNSSDSDSNDSSSNNSNSSDNDSNDSGSEASEIKINPRSESKNNESQETQHAPCNNPKMYVLSMIFELLTDELKSKVANAYLTLPYSKRIQYKINAHRFIPFINLNLNEDIQRIDFALNSNENSHIIELVANEMIPWEITSETLRYRVINKLLDIFKTRSRITKNGCIWLINNIDLVASYFRHSTPQREQQRILFCNLLFTMENFIYNINIQDLLKIIPKHSIPQIIKYFNVRIKKHYEEGSFVDANPFINIIASFGKINVDDSRTKDLLIQIIERTRQEYPFFKVFSRKNIKERGYDELEDFDNDAFNIEYDKMKAYGFLYKSLFAIARHNDLKEVEDKLINYIRALIEVDYHLYPISAEGVFPELHPIFEDAIFDEITAPILTLYRERRDAPRIEILELLLRRNISALNASQFFKLLSTLGSSFYSFTHHVSPEEAAAEIKEICAYLIKKVKSANWNYKTSIFYFELLKLSFAHLPNLAERLAVIQESANNSPIDKILVLWTFHFNQRQKAIQNSDPTLALVSSIIGQYDTMHKPTMR